MTEESQNNELVNDLLNTQFSETIIGASRPTFQDIEPILKKENNYHYLCPKCHIFSFY